MLIREATAEGEALWMEPPPGRTVVAVEGDTVLGSAKRGPSRPGRGAHVATASFLVETNDVAVHVWRSLGFEVIGTVPEAFGSATHGYVGLHVMYRRL